MLLEQRPKRGLAVCPAIAASCVQLQRRHLFSRLSPCSQDAMEDKLIPNGPPSLIGCKKLVIEGGPAARSH